MHIQLVHFHFHCRGHYGTCSSIDQSGTYLKTPAAISSFMFDNTVVWYMSNWISWWSRNTRRQLSPSLTRDRIASGLCGAVVMGDAYESINYSLKWHSVVTAVKAPLAAGVPLPASARASSQINLDSQQRLNDSRFPERNGSHYYLQSRKPGVIKQIQNLPSPRLHFPLGNIHHSCNYSCPPGSRSISWNVLWSSSFYFVLVCSAVLLVRVSGVLSVPCDRTSLKLV